MDKYEGLIDPFYELKMEEVEKGIKVYYKNRKVFTNFYPLSVTSVTPSTAHAYHDAARKHWYDDDNNYINSHFDADEIKPVVQSVNDSVFPLFMFDENHLISVCDVKFLCDKNNVEIDEFQLWLAKKYASLRWMNSTSKDKSFDNLFDSNYAADLYQQVFVKWI